MLTRKPPVVGLRRLWLKVGNSEAADGANAAHTLIEVGCHGGNPPLGVCVVEAIAHR